MKAFASAVCGCRAEGKLLSLLTANPVNQADALKMSANI
jgi:hypothetical protein